MIYWLYQTYQTNQTNSAQTDANNSLIAQEQADAASYAQQIALGNLSGGIGASGGGYSSVPSSGPVSSPVSTTPATTPVSTPTSTTPVSTAPSDPSQGGTLVQAPNGAWVMPGALAPLTGSIGAPSTPETTSPTPSSFTATLFGSRSASGTGGGNPGGRGGANPPTTSSSSLHAIISPAHIGDGTIAEHQSILPTPSTYELSSLGGYR